MQINESVFVSHPKIIIALACAYLTGCVATSETHCPPGHKFAVSELMYFGTATPGGVVTAQEWTDFLRTVVTPRFPEGFTHSQAMGQWQGKSGAIIQEKSFVLTLIHPGDDKSEMSARNIADEYKHRFQQEAVLRVKNVGCVSN